VEDWYKNALQDPRWDYKRKRILNRDNYRCTKCGRDDIKLHVHHIKYKQYGTMPWDYNDFELITLCEYCHKAEHEHQKTLKKYENKDNTNIVDFFIDIFEKKDHKKVKFYHFNTEYNDWNNIKQSYIYSDLKSYFKNKKFKCKYNNIIYYFDLEQYYKKRTTIISHYLIDMCLYLDINIDKSIKPYKYDTNLIFYILEVIKKYLSDNTNIRGLSYDDNMKKNKILYGIDDDIRDFYYKNN
jgi:hypothetical protein